MQEAAAFADHACQQRVKVVSNQRVAQDTYQLRFASKAIAEQATPGQFLMIRLADFDDPLIGRPLALYDTSDGADGSPEFVDVVYLVGGKMTRRLAELLPGQDLVVWGPLGNGFAPQRTDHLIMVAGGIGQTPFVALAKEHLGRRSYGGRSVDSVKRVTLCYGARSAAYLAGLPDFESAGVEVRVSTDDGTAGVHGRVDKVVDDLLSESPGEARRQIVCCGPEPMMKTISHLGKGRGIAVQVSLETPMACGIGICFSCVAPIVGEDGESDFRRTCVEGPVFDAQQIDWDF